MSERSALENMLPSTEQGRLFWVDNFLTTGQCRAIEQELRLVAWNRSLLWKGGEVSERSHRRVSLSAFETRFTSRLREILLDVDAQLTTLIPSFSQFREQWQATIYNRGGAFDLHLDSAYVAEEEAGNRVRSILLHIRAPISGGQTQFPHLDTAVESVSGRLVVWKNLTEDGQPDWEMLHAGAPVTLGQKIILVTWIRERQPSWRTS
jgi:hypothetical protein